MRSLIYVPIIHASADLGSVAKAINKRGIKEFGKEYWEEHRKVVSRYWDLLTDYFSSLDVKGFKVYQDGLVADGDVGKEIVAESLKQGSDNYKIINGMLDRGAHLVQTEHFVFLKKEHKYITGILDSSGLKKFFTLIRYIFLKVLLSINSFIFETTGRI